MSQVLNLKDNELDLLATFLGHDVRVHRDVYRMPESTTQLAMVSKLLIASEQGLGNWRGQSLEDIEVPNEDDGVSPEAQDVPSDRGDYKYGELIWIWSRGHFRMQRTCSCGEGNARNSGSKRFWSQYKVYEKMVRFYVSLY